MKTTTRSLLVVLAGIPAIGRGAADLELRPLSTSVEQYGRIEFEIAVDAQYARPFDAREVDLSILFATPGGRELRVPAFYCQPYERRQVARSGRPAAWIYLAGRPEWRGRFAPAEPGDYSAVAELTDRDGARRSAPVTFSSRPSPSSGYVRVSRQDPRYFEFSDGQPFFPIGQNLAFIGDSQYVTPVNVAEVFEKLSSYGANYLRIWTCCHDWALAVEARKSAWGRTWSWDPPFAPLPDGGNHGEQGVRLEVGKRAVVEVSPTHNVALRPRTEYVLTGRARLWGGACFRRCIPTRAAGAPAASSRLDF